jgi:uncharacterized protein YdaU (DUF1376 family)
MTVHHYPFHVGDYIAATVHLEPMHDLCYRRALDLYYMDERPLPLCKRTLSKRLRVNEVLLSEVLAEFFFEQDDGWHHSRCDAEIAKYAAKSEAAKRAGKLGGSKRASKRLANAKQTPSKRLASATNQNQEPRTNNQFNNPLTPKGVKVVDLDWPSDFPETHKPALRLWWQHKKEKGKTYKPTGWATLCNQQKEKSAEALTADVESSIASNYDGLFPSKPNSNGGSYGKRPANADDIPPASSEPGYVEPVITGDELAF